MGTKTKAIFLAIRVLSFIEKIVPMFLLAWAEHLRSKANQLKSQVDYSEYKVKALERRISHDENNKNKSPGDTIDDYLSKPKPEPRKRDNNVDKPD